MKKLLLSMFVMMGLFFSTFTICLAQQTQEDVLKERSNIYLKDMYKNNYDDFYNAFSQEMKATMTKEQFIETIQAVFKRAGDFQKVLETKYVVDEVYQHVLIYSSHSKENLVFQFVYNKEAELVGVHYYNGEKLLEKENIIKEEDYDKEPLVKLSVSYLASLHNGNTDVLYESLDISLQDKISKKSFAEAWNKVAQQVGYFENIVSISKEEQGEYTKIAVLEKYSVKSLLVYMVYDEEQKVVGFFLQPVEEEGKK